MQIVGFLMRRAQFTYNTWLMLYLFVSRKYCSEAEFLKMTDKVKRGDIVGVRGKPGEMATTNVTPTKNVINGP